jgi:ABC-type multidrug transport system fused ATPase/permease subunit
MTVSIPKKETAEEYVQRNRKRFGGRWAILFNPGNLMLLTLGSFVLVSSIFLLVFNIRVVLALIIFSIFPAAYIAFSLGKKVAEKYDKAGEKAKEEFLQKSSENTEVLEKGGSL